MGVWLLGRFGTEFTQHKEPAVPTHRAIAEDPEVEK